MRPTRPPSTPQEAAAFIQKWASEGADVARQNKPPVSAMLACACTESGFGKGEIFSYTGNPFNLQKWPWVPYPKTDQNFDFVTKTKNATATTPRVLKQAPFNCAKDVPDAVRQWCEWILHWGEADGPPGNPDRNVTPVAIPSQKAARDRLLAMRGRPREFAENLWVVGFTGGQQAAKEFGVVWGERKLARFDP